MNIEVTTEKLDEYMTANHVAIAKNNPTHIVLKKQFGLFTVHRDGFLSELDTDKYSSTTWILKEY